MNCSRERSLCRYVTDTHRNHEQGTDKSTWRRRWDPGQTADRSDRECEHKSKNQPHIHCLQRQSSHC